MYNKELEPHIEFDSVFENKWFCPNAYVNNGLCAGNCVFVQVWMKIVWNSMCRIKWGGRKAALTLRPQWKSCTLSHKIAFPEIKHWEKTFLLNLPICTTASNCL